MNVKTIRQAGRTMPPVTIAVATVNTGAFSWIATGGTRHQAVTSLIHAWRTHAERQGLDPTLVTINDVNVIDGPVGAVFRDNSRAEILPEGHGTHTADDHTRDAEAVGHVTRDEHGQILCNECVAPAFLCRKTGDYFHVDASADACHLVPAMV